MSEYQYYEFSALEQALTKAQQAELRACSKRARITAGGFVNEYHWGDLKADPLDWMARYFDAHIYSTNWGQCDFVLSLSEDSLDRQTVRDYAGGAASQGVYGGPAFSLQIRDARWILVWSLALEDGDDERFQGEDGAGWMARLQPLREELLRGDMRPLYLGWIGRLCNSELDDDDLEPPVPAGLRALTPAQSALVEFLQLDPDLLSVAALASPDLNASASLPGDSAAWIAQLPDAELRETVRLLMAGSGREAERAARRGFAAWRRKQAGADAPAAPRRSAAQIESGRDDAEQLRLAALRQLHEAQERRAQAERLRHLATVAARPQAAWAAIDDLLQRGTGVAYAQAERTVLELSEALAAQGRSDEFRRGLLQLLVTHGQRPAWLARLRKLGLI